MVDALKKLDKKFLILAGFIILLPVVLIIFLVLIQSCGRETKTTYENYEQKMISSAEKYFKDNLPTEEGEYLTVDLKTLVDGNYLKATKKSLDDDCTGSVTVRRNGSSVESNLGGYLNYVVDLKCEKYSTTHLVDKITSEVVTSESGLYSIGDTYVFRGNKVNNYINFFGQVYRIMSIDKDGIIRLIKDTSENLPRMWDNKFNVEANKAYGKNIYKDSAILSYLLLDYQNSKKISKKAKAHIVAYDTCIGKRESKDNSINSDLDCGEKLERQVISLPNVSDYAIASIDPDCVSLDSRACANYNYLSSVISTSWTSNPVLENTYQVFYISSGIYRYQNANSTSKYNIVIYIDGNELYKEGNGSLTNPYIVK